MRKIMNAVCVGIMCLLAAPNSQSYAVAITEKREGGRSTRPLAEVKVDTDG